jgi:hypothetical protein
MGMPHAFELGFALAGGWGVRHTDPRPWVGTRAFEQEERHRRVLPRLPAASRNVVNLPFQGRFLPVMQRVSEWQAISLTHCEISRDAS